MKRRVAVRLMLSLLTVFLLITGAYAGGWATITLNEFPDYAVAGKILNLSFVVRQHGRTLLSGLKPSVRATTSAGLAAKAAVTAGPAPGEYVAALTMPEPGDWTITVESGFNDNEITLAPLKVIASGIPGPAAFAPATRGVRLFAAKGCVGCHRHIEVNPQRTTEARFDLTGKRFPQDYLRKFLADPSIKPAEMPNLKLKADEIDALAAFLNKGLAKTADERR